MQFAISIPAPAQAPTRTNKQLHSLYKFEPQRNPLQGLINPRPQWCQMSYTDYKNTSLGEIHTLIEIIAIYLMKIWKNYRGAEFLSLSGADLKENSTTSRHSHLQMNEQKMFSFPMMLVSLLPHSAEAVSGQLPVVPKVNIVKVHQSRGEDTQHPGPVPCAVVLVWSSHNVPHDNGLYPLLLKNRVTVRVTHLWWQIVLILTSHRRTRVLKF